MTNKQALQVAKRVHFWQKELASLGIGHWRIESVSCVDEVPGSPGALAAVAPSSSYASVTFWFKNDHVEDSNPRELDESIVHEWIHIVMRDLDVAIESVDDQLSRSVYELWNDRVTHERETLVDMLARDIVARHYAARE